MTKEERDELPVMPPLNQREALVRALKLALTATSDARVNMAILLAQDLAQGLSELDIARCKKQALKELNEETV